MYWQFEIFLFILLIATAGTALYVKDLLVAVVLLSVYSFLVAILFVSMGAIDVGFTETVVGAGVSSVLFVIMIFKTSRRSKD